MFSFGMRLVAKHCYEFIATNEVCCESFLNG